jgi:hypothetical protein
MRTIEWYSEKFRDSYFEEFQALVTEGSIYHFNESNKYGYIVFNNDFLKKNSVLAIGKYGDAELFLKNKSTFFKQKLILYDPKSDLTIGKIDFLEFTFKNNILNSSPKMKTIFNKKQVFELEIEFCKRYTVIIAKLNVERIKKRWYNSIFSTEIKGSIEFNDEVEDELIISIFFYFDYYLRSRNTN